MCSMPIARLDQNNKMYKIVDIDRRFDDAIQIKAFDYKL